MEQTTNAAAAGEREARASWAVTQPWRGIFGTAVTLGIVAVITVSFDMGAFQGLFTLLIMSMVPIEVVMGLGWGGKYPPTEGIPQPWVGMLLTSFMALLGTIICFAILGFLGAGAAQPLVNVYSITTVITIFFLVVAFGTWPFSGLPLPARGFLTLLAAYIIALLVLQLSNFSVLSYPTGVKPSPIGAVPFYAAGGPLAAFAGIAPSGPYSWESALTFYYWMVHFLFVFIMLGMWPFSTRPGLMRQPILGILLVITCTICAAIVYFIAVGVLNVVPLKFLLYGICWLFGILWFLVMLQMWPGRALQGPAGGVLNLVLSIGVGILSYYAVSAFCQGHFGKAFTYPNSIFSMANVMLGLTFPCWTAYAMFWDFWPLPPTPPPPESK
jgi:hypothetical protein